MACAERPARAETSIRPGPAVDSYVVPHPSKTAGYKASEDHSFFERSMTDKLMRARRLLFVVVVCLFCLQVSPFSSSLHWLIACLQVTIPSTRSITSPCPWGAAENNATWLLSPPQCKYWTQATGPLRTNVVLFLMWQTFTFVVWLFLFLFFCLDFILVLEQMEVIY